MLVVFELLMILTYAIDDKWVKNNVVVSAGTLKEQGITFAFDENDNRTKKDNWTEAYILNMCIHTHDGNSFITNAITNPYYNQDNNRIDDLIEGIDKKANDSYGRYWQGQLTIIRPLLLLFNLEQIYILFTVLFVLALLLCLYRIYKTTNIYYALALLFSFMLIKTYVICFSTKLYFSFLISLVFTIIITYLKRCSFNTDLVRKLFFIIAAITVYTDFFSTPLVTLGLPLTTLIIKEKDIMNRYSYKELFINFFKIVLAWISGYVVFGISNWILYILFSNDYFLAIEGIVSRFVMWIGLTEYNGNHYDKLAGINNILLIFTQSPTLVPVYVMLYTLSIVTIFVLSYKKYKYNLLLLFISGLPFIWWLIASTSVNVHAAHVFRTIIINLYSMLCSVFSLFDKNDTSK